LGSAERNQEEAAKLKFWSPALLRDPSCEVFMPNPKRRHSQARTSKRRSHDHLTAQSLSECPNCHERKLPHRACPKCGYYKGREIVEVEESTS
jgi:large subunit ribosomal protein L32